MKQITGKCKYTSHSSCTFTVTGTLSSNGIRKIIYIIYKFTQIYI
jgi:hypothetical protein